MICFKCELWLYTNSIQIQTKFMFEYDSWFKNKSCINMNHVRLMAFATDDLRICCAIKI